jgi:hypothetical protein
MGFILNVTKLLPRAIDLYIHLFSLYLTSIIHFRELY